ncbi:MAG TPA: hypothetical protein VHI93_04555 [Candidatus Thermoplasmatota archaeon]|nr:hypothetical protein [Candidatus Thermoplasmatota archaeon]
MAFPNAATLLALLLLAGCAEAPVADPSHSGNPAGAGAADLALREASLTAATPRGQAWHNGSLAATDYRVCAGTCTAGGKDVDLSPMLAKGAWARLNVTLAWRDPGEEAGWDLVGGHVLYLQLDTGDDLVLRWQETHGAARIAVGIVLFHGGDRPVVASVLRNFQGSGPTTDYTLHVEAAPLGFSPVAPLALRAAATASTLVASTAVGGGTVRVWDGADRFAGDFPLRAPATHIDLRNLTRGEPVLQVVDAPADLSLGVLQPAAAPPPTLRPLTLKVVQGTPRDVPTQGALDWQFEVAQPPLWLGLAWHAEGGDGNGCLSLAGPTACYATVQGSGHVRSPSGTLVEMEWDCYLCGGQARASSAAGATGLVAGTYLGHYEHAGSANFQVAEFQVTYER